MILRQLGEIAPGLHVLGSTAIPAFLWDGPEPVIFEAGVSSLGPAYAHDAARLLGEGRQPASLFLSHMHFDHCGAAAYLAQAFPGLKIHASQRAADILARPHALELIARLNHNAAGLVRSLDPALDSGVQFAPFAIDRVLADGDQLTLGGGEVLRVLATPGHTWDMLSYHLPAQRILLASEAVGCPTQGGHIITEFLVDYDAYLDSLRRLAGLEVEVLCLAHYAVLTGREAQDYFGQALNAAREFREWVEDLLKREEFDVSRVVSLIKRQEWDPRPQPKQPEPAYLLNLQARVEHLAAKLTARG